MVELVVDLALKCGAAVIILSFGEDFFAGCGARIDGGVLESP